MRITLELSMYPLQADYEPAILAFIKHLESVPELTLKVNALSTQVQGEMKWVFQAVQHGISAHFGNGGRAAIVMKVLPGDIDLDYEHST